MEKSAATTDLININVIIADRPYPLKIKREEEVNVREAAKLINEKVLELQQTYAAKDKQDYLAMSALMFAVEHISRKNTSSHTDESVSGALDQLDQILSNALAGHH